jgi:hypothetical protein
MKNKAILLGIDGFLKGNENCIISYWPFIKCKNTERYAVVLKLGWECDSGKYLSWKSSEEEIKQVGVYFDLKQEVVINNDELVALIGPAFFENVKEVGDMEILDALATRIPIQDGFSIKCMTYKDYNSFLETLANTTKKTFDEEIGKLSRKSKELNRKCKAALDLFAGNTMANPEDRYIIQLAAALIEKDTRAYREYLEFAVIDYEDSGISREVIGDWVEQYFKITNRKLYELLYSPPPKDREFIKEVVKTSFPIVNQDISEPLNTISKKIVEDLTNSVKNLLLNQKGMEEKKTEDNSPPSNGNDRKSYYNPSLPFNHYSQFLSI